MEELQYSAAPDFYIYRMFSVSCLPNNVQCVCSVAFMLLHCHWGNWQHLNQRPLRTQNTHSREAAGLADLLLGNILLQIAEVSASSTSCCQWLKQNKPKTTTEWGSAVMRGTLCGSTHFFFQACHLKLPQRDKEITPFKRLTVSFFIFILCVCLGACSHLTQQKHIPLLRWNKMREHGFPTRCVSTLVLKQEPPVQTGLSGTLNFLTFTNLLTFSVFFFYT